MELTKIFTGMENGPEAIQDNFKKISDNISDTGWRTDGVTFLNGSTPVADDPSTPFFNQPAYRVITIDKTNIILLHGMLKAGTAGLVIQFPKNVAPNEYYIQSMPSGNWQLNSDGTLLKAGSNAFSNAFFYFQYVKEA